MKAYLAGKITGDKNYKSKFAMYEQQLQNGGYIVLTPAILPSGLTMSDYMRICFAMIDCADAVVFMPDWRESGGAQVEKAYCEYIGKDVSYIGEDAK